MLDIPDADVIVGKTPTPPEGFEITRVDVVVRLRRRDLSRTNTAAFEILCPALYRAFMYWSRRGERA